MGDESEGPSYARIKDWVLQCFFDGCRDLAIREGRSHAEVLGYVAYQFEGAFSSPVENVMCWLAQLILSGGWHADAAAYLRQKIADQLALNGIDGLLFSVSPEDRESLRHDLQMLRFT